MAGTWTIASVGVLLCVLSGCGLEKATTEIDPNDGSTSRDVAVGEPDGAPPQDAGLDAAAPPLPDDSGTEPAPDSASGDMATPADSGPPDLGLPPLEPGAPLGSFDLTFYWVAFEADHPGGVATDLYADDCSVIAVVARDFADAIRLEGTGRLLDGRMLNVSGSCSCARSPCFFELDAEHPWGVGVMNRPLRPFRSIAVDRAVLDIASSYYIAELDGLLLPGDAPWGDFVHDGCVLADDVGGGIIGNHIDLFAGLREHYRTLVGEVGDPITLHEGGARCP